MTTLDLPSGATAKVNPDLDDDDLEEVLTT